MESEMLLKAVIQRKLKLLRLLIDGGANINYQGYDGKTALVLACSQLADSHNENDNILFDMIKFLLRNGADPNIQDSNGRTPIMYAAQGYMCASIGRELIKYGADPSLSDAKGGHLSSYICLSYRQDNNRTHFDTRPKEHVNTKSRRTSAEHVSVYPIVPQRKTMSTVTRPELIFNDKSLLELSKSYQKTRLTTTEEECIMETTEVTKAAIAQRKTTSTLQEYFTKDSSSTDNTDLSTCHHESRLETAEKERGIESTEIASVQQKSMSAFPGQEFVVNDFNSTDKQVSNSPVNVQRKKVSTVTSPELFYESYSTDRCIGELSSSNQMTRRMIAGGEWGIQATEVVTPRRKISTITRPKLNIHNYSSENGISHVSDVLKRNIVSTISGPDFISTDSNSIDKSLPIDMKNENVEVNKSVRTRRETVTKEQFASIRGQPETISVDISPENCVKLTKQKLRRHTTTDCMDSLKFISKMENYKISSQSIGMHDKLPPINKPSLSQSYY